MDSLGGAGATMAIACERGGAVAGRAATSASTSAGFW
jgi:hypothetical protein